MSRFLLAALILILPVTGSGESPSEDEAALRHLKTVLWPQAYRTQDVALLDRILHPTFQMIDAEGKRSTKEAELAFVAANAWDPGAFEYRIERLDVYDGRLAVVDGQGVASAYSYRSSNVLIKEDGRWQAIVSHVSGVESRDDADR